MYLGRVGALRRQYLSVPFVESFQTDKGQRVSAQGPRHGPSAVGRQAFARLTADESENLSQGVISIFFLRESTVFSRARSFLCCFCLRVGDLADHNCVFILESGVGWVGVKGDKAPRLSNTSWPHAILLRAPPCISFDAHQR